LSLLFILQHNKLCFLANRHLIYAEQPDFKNAEDGPVKMAH